MKTVWIVNHYAEEPEGAGGGRHYSLARHLLGQGWKTFIVGASIEHLTGRQRLEQAEKARLEEHGGVPFLWLKTPSYSGNGLDRIRNMLTFCARALVPANLAGLERPDVIIGSSIHPFAAWAALRLARRHNVPFVFEVRDLWPQALIEMGRLKEKSPVAYFMRRLEKHLYNSAEKIIVLWPNAGDYIGALGIDRRKVLWLSNGIDLDEWPEWAPAPAKDDFTLMYFGAHGGANGLDNVIRAMSLVQASPQGARIRLRMVGDGPQKPALQELAHQVGARNIVFEPPVSKSAIPALAAEADGFVFNLIDAPMFQYGISPRKLFDFMAAGRPTIFCCRATNDPVQEAGGGLSVEPGNPRILADAILRLAAIPPLQREAMGQAARRHVSAHYSYEMLAKRLAEALNAVAR